MSLWARLWRRTAEPVRQRRFDAAGGHRWEAQPQFGRTGSETLAASAPIRSRARHAYANDPWIRNGVNALAAGLTGTGITPASADPDPETRARIDAAIGAWAGVADIDGQTDLFGLQTQVGVALVVVGEAFLRLVETPEGLRVQLIPAEMIDESDTRELAGGGHRIAGIEFDGDGRRVAYMLLPNRPTDLFATAKSAIRIPSADMLHVMQPLGAGQVRGMSWLAPVLLRANELDQLEDALLIGVKTSAMFCGFLKDVNGTANGSPFDGVTDGNVMTAGLEPGTLQFLSTGCDADFTTPQQAQQTHEFVSHQLRAIASGLGVPYYALSGDLSQSSYGSMRAGLISFKQRLEQIQFGCLIPQMCQPVFERAVASLALRGDLEAGFGRAVANHYPAPMPWIDPGKDSAAIHERLKMGLMSRRQAAAELGFSVEALDAEIAADRAREAALGLAFDDK